MGKQENQDPTESVAYRLGNYVENRIGTDISRRFEAPVLEGMPDNQIWYRIRIPEGIAGDGSAYHIYLKQSLFLYKYQVLAYPQQLYSIVS